MSGPPASWMPTSTTSSSCSSVFNAATHGPAGAHDFSDAADDQGSGQRRHPVHSLDWQSESCKLLASSSPCRPSRMSGRLGELLLQDALISPETRGCRGRLAQTKPGATPCCSFRARRRFWQAIRRAQDGRRESYKAVRTTSAAARLMRRQSSQSLGVSGAPGHLYSATMR